MSERQKSRSPPSGPPGGHVVTSDLSLSQALQQFVQHETRFLRCPEDGPDPRRYTASRAAFSQLIGRAAAYRSLLLTIKMEYDAAIRELKRREDEDRASQRSEAAATSQTRSVAICQRRAAQLRDRLSVLQRDTAELREQVQRRRWSTQQRTWIPGLTVAQSEDPVALDRHLKDLEARRDALLDQKRPCVPLEVKAELDVKLQAAERRRHRLSADNLRLTVLYKRLRSVCDRLTSWEEEQQEEEQEEVPLEGLLGSTLENVRQADVMDGGGGRSIELFEDDEPRGVDESRLLMGQLDRFVEVFDSAQYEDAALLAARAPRGVLRNLDTMQMFEGVEGPPGSVPPPFLFFKSLLITVPAGDKLSSPLSLQGVRWALQHGAVQLIAHAVTQNKLTFSEDLGDVLTEHAQMNPGVADVCLALASVAYEACRLDRKTALSMCRRGLIHGAAELMTHCEDLTAEDCMWVLCHSPSLSLLQLLTEPRRGRAAILPVGVACVALLSGAQQQQQLALQLLDSFVSRGRGVLEEVILEDSSSSVDVWNEVASLCSELKQDDLSRAVMSVLLDQSGTRILSPDLEGARLMEHVFL